MTRCDPIIPCRKVQNPILRKYATYPLLQRHLTSPDDGIFILRTPPPIYMASPLARLSDDNAAGGFARDPAAVREFTPGGKAGILARNETSWMRLKSISPYTNGQTSTDLPPHPFHDVPATVCTQSVLSQPPTVPLSILCCIPATVSTQVPKYCTPASDALPLTSQSCSGPRTLHPSELRVISTVPGRRHT